MPRLSAAPRRLWPGRMAAACLAVTAAALVLAAWPAAHAAATPAVHRPAITSAAFTVSEPLGRTLTVWQGGLAAGPSPAASPAPSPSVSPSVPAAGSGGCGFFDFACQAEHAIDSWFASLVRSAINPLFGLLGQTLLSTPQVGGFSTVRSLWTGSLAVADTSYVLLVVVGGIIVMGHETLQSSYAVKDIAPRLVTGFVAANLSLLAAGKAIQFADGMSAALAGRGLNPAAASAMLRSLIDRVLSEGGMFFILLALFAVALVLVLTVIYVARLMLTVVLVAMAPLALACHALPQTEGIARWWWRACAGILAIQAAQALVLDAALRVFFTEQWTSALMNGAGHPGTAAAFDAVQLLCLLYILVRIPFWIFRRVWSSGGRSPVRSAARFVFAAAVLRRISPALSGRAGGGRRAGGRARADGGLPAARDRAGGDQALAPGQGLHRARRRHLVAPARAARVARADLDRDPSRLAAALHREQAVRAARDHGSSSPGRARPRTRNHRRIPRADLSGQHGTRNRRRFPLTGPSRHARHRGRHRCRRPESSHLPGTRNRRRFPPAGHGTRYRRRFPPPAPSGQPPRRGPGQKEGSGDEITATAGSRVTLAAPGRADGPTRMNAP